MMNAGMESYVMSIELVRAPFYTGRAKEKNVYFIFYLNTFRHNLFTFEKGK